MEQRQPPRNIIPTTGTSTNVKPRLFSSIIETPTNESSTNEEVINNSTLKCWNCGKTGHAYTDCPDK